jgi:hypothetical protein
MFRCLCWNNFAQTNSAKEFSTDSRPKRARPKNDATRTKLKRSRLHGAPIEPAAPDYLAKFDDVCLPRAAD